jgi:glycosyltransferase involved in cell wall biosynthesis
MSAVHLWKVLARMDTHSLVPGPIEAGSRTAQEVAISDVRPPSERGGRDLRTGAISLTAAVKGVRTLRILHVLAPAEVGGLERVVLSLAAGLRADGHDIHVAAVLGRPAEHSIFAPLRRAGVVVHPLTIRRRAYLRERSAVESVCRQIHPDIVHTHGYRADVIDAPVARRLGIRTVSTFHGFTGGAWKNRAYELLQLFALRNFDAIVAVARPQAIHLVRSGIPASRIRVVPNAWYHDQDPLARRQARAAFRVPHGRFHVGWVGRLSWEKGADIFLDAVALLKDLPIVVSMVGDGPERLALEQQARRLGIGSLVTWWGTLPNAGRVFPGFDAFVISSRTEGTPIVLFEAMRSNVPVVAAAVGGVPDVVSGGQAALVSPRDAVALASAIRGVYHDPQMAQARASHARERLRDYDGASWVRQYGALYYSLLASPASLHQ